MVLGASWEAPFGLTWLLEGCGQGYLNLLFHVRCSWVVLLPGFMRVMFRAIGTYYLHIRRTKSQWVLGRSSREGGVLFCHVPSFSAFGKRDSCMVKVDDKGYPGVSMTLTTRGHYSK